MKEFDNLIINRFTHFQISALCHHDRPLSNYPHYHIIKLSPLSNYLIIPIITLTIRSQGNFHKEIGTLVFARFETDVAIVGFNDFFADSQP